MESVETSHQTLSKRPEYKHDCVNGRCLSLSTSQLSNNASRTVLSISSVYFGSSLGFRPEFLDSFTKLIRLKTYRYFICVGFRNNNNSCTK